MYNNLENEESDSLPFFSLYESHHFHVTPPHQEKVKEKYTFQ